MSDTTSEVEKARAEIAATRTALAETTAALKVKSDVKTRLTQAVKANQTALAAVGGGLALLVVLRTWSKKRSKGTRSKKR
ncbi:MAG: hypothetical protein JWO12_2583 [Frankiales bacterium]|nr:hypothetical protein [Frankiales bacterium]